METLVNCIHPLFDETKWQLLKREENTVYYRYKPTYVVEFIIHLLPKTEEIEVSVPLNQEVLYKNKFYNVNTAVDYIKMHINEYENSYH